MLYGQIVFCCTMFSKHRSATVLRKSVFEPLTFHKSRHPHLSTVPLLSPTGTKQDRLSLSEKLALLRTSYYHITVLVLSSSQSFLKELPVEQH